MAGPIVPKPHLLTLPREIRNMIYSYVHEPAFVTVDEARDKPYEEQGGTPLDKTPFTVEIVNAPCFNLLQVHPRLEAEYKEEKAWKTFTVRVKIDWEEWVRAKSNPDSVEHSSLTRHLKGSWREACAQAIHLTVMVTFAEDYFIQEGIQHPWIDFMELHTIMPNLKTIRVFQRSSRERYMWSCRPVMSSFPIRRTVFRDSELDAELLEDLAIGSYEQDDLLESHEIEVVTDDDEKTNPLRQFWSHEEILEVDAFFRHSNGDGKGQLGMFT
jgi:hypothetical protein